MEDCSGRAGVGLAPKTIADIHGIISKALGDAVTLGKVHCNVADAVDSPSGAKRATTSGRPSSCAFLDEVHDDRWYAAWLLFVTTGIRRGEVAGLTWDDVNLVAGQVRIDWTLGVVRNKPTWKPRPKSAAGSGGWRSTRRRSRRSVSIGGSTRSGCASGQHGGADLPRIRLHDVRHTYASAALTNATGWHEMKLISQRLGHATIGITRHVLARPSVCLSSWKTRPSSSVPAKASATAGFHTRRRKLARRSGRPRRGRERQPRGLHRRRGEVASCRSMMIRWRSRSTRSSSRPASPQRRPTQPAGQDQGAVVVRPDPRRHRRLRLLVSMRAAGVDHGECRSIR